MSVLSANSRERELAPEQAEMLSKYIVNHHIMFIIFSIIEKHERNLAFLKATFKDIPEKFMKGHGSRFEVN